MLHAKIVDIKEKKISLSDAEKFISSNTYGASIFFTGTVRDQNNDKNEERRRAGRERNDVDSRTSCQINRGQRNLIKFTLVLYY